MARLDDYQLVRVLAHGGMGVVHEAVERATGRRVAVKRLLGPLDRDLVARLLVEGRALARLDHPGIVRVHALDEAPGGPFMVMDLVAGESLDRVLRREGPLAPERARAIVATLTEALDHAHALGVLHRDLKPANVLVTPDDEVKLIDFGLAKLQVDGGSLGHLTRTGEMLGTPGYMAPEQADGRPVDARTDVYGLGATLHALLTGRAPFEGPNAIAVLEGVLTREPLAPSRLRPGVPRALDEVVLACLAKDPAARPASMSALRERLVGGPARRGARRAAPPTALVATAGTIVVATAAGAWWATRAASVDAGERPLRVAPVASSSTTAAVDTRRAALEVAERTVRARPDDPEAWLDLARERARQGDLTGALAPPPADAPRADWITHARALLSAGRPDEALSILPAGDDRQLVLLRFQAVVARCEDDPTRLATARELPEVEALARHVDQDPRWAEGLFERERLLVLLSPETARAGAGAEALHALGAGVLARRLLAAATLHRSAPTALEHIDAAIAGSPGPSATLHATRGHILFVAGRLDEAADELTRALELEPLSRRAYHLRSGVREAQRRLREAAADAEQELALVGPSGSPTLRLRPAELLLRGGHVEEARRALDGVPTSAAALAAFLRLKGDLLLAEGDEAGATRAYEQILEGGLPGLASDYEHASRQLAGLGRPGPRWQEAFVRSLERSHDAAAWTRAALALLRDAPDLAEAAAMRALELGAGREAYALRAKVRLQLGRPWEALADHDEVVEMTPDDDPMRPLVLLDRSLSRAAVGDLLGALHDVRTAQPMARGAAVGVARTERDRLERELAALAEVAAAATHAIRGTVQTKAALERLQAAAPYRAESTRLKLVYVWTLRAIGRALPDRRMVDTAERVLDDVERAGALPERARALRRRFEQDEVDLRRAEGDDPVARIRGLLALRRYPEAVDALSALTGHPSALELELELARRLRAAGDLENARARYQRLEVDEGTDAWWEVVLGVAEVAHDTDQTTPELLKVLADLSLHPGPRGGRAALEHARALLVVGRADEAVEAARRAEALTEAALSATAPDDEPARIALRGPLVEAALLRGRALLALERRREARDALQGAALLASLLTLDDHHRLKAEVRDRALKAFPDDDEVVRAAHLAFP